MQQARGWSTRGTACAAYVLAPQIAPRVVYFPFWPWQVGLCTTMHTVNRSPGPFPTALRTAGSFCGMGGKTEEILNYKGR